MRRATNPDALHCGVCDRRFGDVTALNSHEAEHDAEQRARDVSTVQSCRDDARFEREAAAREFTLEGADQ